MADTSQIVQEVISEGAKIADAAEAATAVVRKIVTAGQAFVASQDFASLRSLFDELFHKAPEVGAAVASTPDSK